VSVEITQEEAFNMFVSTRSQALMRTAYLLTGDAQLAEDLVQTALFNAARRWSRIDGAHEAYVRRVMYHESVSRWRRRRVRESPYDDLADVRVTTDADVAMRVTLAEALARLTPRQRTVLVLRFYEDLTERQTAAVLDIGVGTVKSLTRQALARLRVLAPDLAELVGAGGEPE
jgi:RNA polymerase sigma-70 factor (sigma-E family)